MSGIVRLASLISLLVSFGGSSGHTLRSSNSEDGKKGPILELHVKVGLDGGSWNTGVDEVMNYDSNNCPRPGSTGNVAISTTLLVDDWIVLQQRINISNRAPFEQSAWKEYKHGFGQPGESFWLGLEQVHQQTNRAPHKLRIEFKLMNGSWYSAEYDTFRVESESKQYRIHVGGYSGDFYDIMNNYHSHHNSRGLINGMKFSTTDRQNDYWYGSNDTPCAFRHGGGWWFNFCFSFNPNGVKDSPGSSVHYKGDFLKLSASRMMMKRK